MTDLVVMRPVADLRVGDVVVRWSDRYVVERVAPNADKGVATLTLRRMSGAGANPLVVVRPLGSSVLVLN